MGARPKPTARICIEASSSNPQHGHGGQASLGLFGLPSATGRARQQATPPKADDSARKVGGLIFVQHDEFVPKATPAMLRAAYASDMREAFPHHADDEEADFVRRCAGAGHVEATLAMN